MRTPSLLSLGFCLSMSSAWGLDLTTLWDFSRPDVSEQRFNAALETAAGDDALILRTQIARTYVLRKDFDGARRVLGSIEAAASQAGPEAQVRFHLEPGRTFASGAHPPDLLTAEAVERARKAYGRALELARAARLDGLAVDAIHMFAFVDKSPADQLKWSEAALGLALTSQQADARRWEATARNNVGYSLHQLGRYDEALTQFQQALAIRERGANVRATHSARWMVAWTLRSLGRADEALQMQRALEKAADAAGTPDPAVYRELAALHRIKGDLPGELHYAQLASTASKP